MTLKHLTIVNAMTYDPEPDEVAAPLLHSKGCSGDSTQAPDVRAGYFADRFRGRWAVVCHVTAVHEDAAGWVLTEGLVGDGVGRWEGVRW